MTSIDSTDLPVHPESQPSPGRSARLLRGRRGLILLGVLVLGTGAAFNWSWLVAIGAGPLLPTALPCVAMCALGLCMNRMNGSSKGETSQKGIGEAPPPDGQAKAGGSCCAHAADVSPRLGLLHSAALAIALMIAWVAPVLAHSLEEVGQDLRDNDRYFQPVDSEAPGFTMQDADGRLVSLASLHGKVVVLNFIYANCPDVCPLHAERIAELQTMINQTPMKAMVEFVTITTDPKRDTGEVLRGYGNAHGLDPANWMFLTAAPDQPEDSTRKIAEAYGLKFTQGDDGMQMHGIVTHVIDQDGRLRARFHGLKFEPVNLVIFVNALTNRAQKPHGHPSSGFWDKLKGLF
ncbi:hypothetical protein MAMO4S_04119 [Mesorhizobium amorphae]